MHSCQLESRRKCESILGMRHQVLWFLSRLEEGAVCVSPWLSVWRCFYSKADCTVSGCLYTISIRMEEEQPLPHASPPVWRPLFASQSVTFFFFFHSLLRLTVFHQVFLRTDELSLFLTAPFICLISMEVDVWVGKLVASDMCVWDINLCVCVCAYVYICVLLNLWTDVMLSVFVTHPGSSRSQEFYKRKWQNVDATACRHIWNSALGCRKLWNYGWRVLHQTL